MRGLVKRVISEPGAESPEGFRRRVRMLAVTYAVLFLARCTGEVLLALKGKLFVTLAQRSNVETLTIVFLLIFYGYLAAISAPGALGAARMAAFVIRRRFAHDLSAERQRQMHALGRRGDGPWAALGKALERGDGQPLRFELRDGGAFHGVIEVDGARVSQLDALRGGSADLLAYFVRQVAAVAGEEVPIVAWGQIEEDVGERYLAQVQFGRSLQRHLQSPPLWPTVSLTAQQAEEIAGRLQRIVPLLLDDALLPDWEYEAEHKLPVIPEPLGLVSLGRSTKRADPLATMGFATLMVLITLGVIVLFVVHPPWVPG